MSIEQVPTSAVTFVETQHGRLRREQRGIDKKDLQAAIKYGERFGTHPRPNGDETSKYVYNDITYIVNEVTREEVTSYAKPLELERVPISASALLAHNNAVQRTQQDLDSWTSNSVIVVDTSGSMRAADVWGTRSRLAAVWVSIALDFLAPRLESGEACETDVISILTMELEPTTVVLEQPSTWLLYNQLVDIYTENQVPAQNHGPFLPGLLSAQKLLTRNLNTNRGMSLTILSDGAPSGQVAKRVDRPVMTKSEWNDRIVQEVEQLATKFGPTLTFASIGIGSSDDFALLKRMAESAADFGVKSKFMLPSMTSSSLGKIFTSVASSLTSTQTEMTDLDSLKQRQVRQVNRESRRKASQDIVEVSSEDFWIYPRGKVVRLIYKEWFEGRKRMHSFDKVPLQSTTAEYVAIGKSAFGEGAERFAYRFFEVDTDGKTIVGKPLVAKENRMILAHEQHADEKARMKFVRTFYQTQQLARRLAGEFNKKLDETRRVDRRTPRIAFLDCSVYQLDDKIYWKASVLVEEKLDHTQWHKWNANNGFIDSMKEVPSFCQVTLRNAFAKVDAEDLTEIEEASDEDDEVDVTVEPTKEPKIFSPSEVAQAFSHFTYWASGRKRLVCDLQGVYDEKSRILRLSDPVIHYHSSGGESRSRVHGDTDRGRKGFAMFFHTHKEEGQCGHLCKLVIRGFRRPCYPHQGAPPESRRVEGEKGG